MAWFARTFAILLLMTGCAMAGAPKWVKKGRVDCSLAPCPSVYSAVGHTTGIRNPAFRQTTAAANARAELAKVVSRKLRRAPTKEFQALVLESTMGVEIVDRWVSKKGDEYALATLSEESFRKALEAQPNLSPGEREALEKQAAALWGR